MENVKQNNDAIQQKIRVGHRGGVWSWLLALLGGSLAVHAGYPGYLNADTFGQLRHLLTGQLYDRHSPFMSWLWSGLLKLFPGPVGLLVLDNLLIWGALALMACVSVRACGRWALAIMALPLLPGLFNYLGNIHKDVLLAALLLAGFACAYLGNGGINNRLGRGFCRLLANAFALAAFLVRPNVYFALLPLILYANSFLGTKRNVLCCLILSLMMPVVLITHSRWMNPMPTHPGDSVKTFHLLGLSYLEGRNLFPGQWSQAQSKAIVDSCYSPVQWDTAALWGQCDFIFHGLDQQKLWGSPDLTKTWLTQLLSHPLKAFSLMGVTYRKSMRDPNSPVMLFQVPKDEIVVWEVDPPLRTTTVWAQKYMQSVLNHHMSRPLLFAIVTLLGLGLLLWLRLAAQRQGRFALVLFLSAALYQLTYFPVNVSTEYRYFYWSGFGAYLGLLMTLLAWRARHLGAGNHEAAIALSSPLRWTSCLVVAAMFVFALMPFKLPTASRYLKLQPLGEGAVTLTAAKMASAPTWMGMFRAHLQGDDWHWLPEGEWHTTAHNPLTVSFRRELLQAVEIGLLSGPQGGKVQIKERNHVEVVDTWAQEVGEIKVSLPYRGELAALGAVRAWKQLLIVLAVVFLLMMGLLRLCGRAKSSSTVEG